MRVADLKNKKIVIWGLGHEGKAAAGFICQHLPGQTATLVDESEGPDKVKGDLPPNYPIIRGTSTIGAALDAADIVIKSPGVSLYHPLIQRLKEKGTPVTSLLNLWLAEPHTAKIIGVTGTKGKSTTSSLLAHVLKGLAQKTAFAGNIGVPVVDIDGNDTDFAVIEVSSYQAADLAETIDLAILVSLQPEHLDWHRTPDRYFSDKLNLLARARTKIINDETVPDARRCGLKPENTLFFNRPDGLHTRGGEIYDAAQRIGIPPNIYLTRPHNLSNVCAVLTAIKFFGFDLFAALATMADYKALPHRQQEIGERDGILYVNDSIATAPHATIAALEVYRDRPISLIAGGFDRGIDYATLVAYIVAHNTHAVILMGPSGQRVFDALTAHRKERTFVVPSMKEAVAVASMHTPKGGAVLLSPAAPSYGMFRDFIERGESFATEAGFTRR